MLGQIMGWTSHYKSDQEPRNNDGCGCSYNAITKTWECNVWRILNRKKAVDHPGQSANDLLPVCMAEFVDRLDQISGGLQNVVRTEGGEFGIHVTSTFVPGLSFEPTTLRLIADLGLSMDVDVVIYASDDI